MVLFYTGAISPDTPSNAFQSLGGFVSNTQIPNNIINNLFSTITKSALQSNQKETKMIVLKNTLTTPVTGLKIWTVVTSTLFTLKIAAVSPAFDSSCNKYYFEQIQSTEESPYQAVLESHETEVNANVI